LNLAKGDVEIAKRLSCFGLRSNSFKAVVLCGYTTLSPIQEGLAIPELMLGRDLVGRA